MKTARDFYRLLTRFKRYKDALKLIATGGCKHLGQGRFPSDQESVCPVCTAREALGWPPS